MAPPQLSITLDSEDRVQLSIEHNGQLAESVYQPVFPRDLALLIKQKEEEYGVTADLAIEDTGGITTPFKSKYLTVHTTAGGYTYAERLGKDSIAFILVDRNSNKYGLVNEYKPPIQRYEVTAFGGSLDKDISMERLVMEEVAEEAGFHVGKDAITFVMKTLVSTQMNQYCYLYLVDITGIPRTMHNPETYMEAMSSVVWRTYEQIQQGNDWKALCLAAHHVQIGV